MKDLGRMAVIYNRQSENFGLVANFFKKIVKMFANSKKSANFVIGFSKVLKSVAILPNDKSYLIYDA